MPPATKLTVPALAPSRTLVRGHDRAPDVVAFEVALVDFFVRGAELLGVPRSVAAIYGIIFASPAPLSFADVEARLDISKGSISQGMRVLREIGAVRVVEGNDIRRDYFAPDLELRKLVVHFLDERLQRQLSDGSERLKQLSRAVPDAGAADTATLRERIRQLKTWHDKTKSDRTRIHSFFRVERFALRANLASRRASSRDGSEREGERESESESERERG